MTEQTPSDKRLLQALSSTLNSAIHEWNYDAADILEDLERCIATTLFMSDSDDAAVKRYLELCLTPIVTAQVKFLRNLNDNASTPTTETVTTAPADLSNN